MIKIDKDFPLPTKYPFEQMEVGDSFALPPSASRENVAAATSRYGKNHKKIFTVRKSNDGTFRCWRLK